ncbi:MAG: rRNA (cytidine1402-2-O)-methyltransferase, partial [Acidobacteriota bacterium]|nr:rRNA (cytidine1402-2-O)-methyltransferase [Acidobacteriota bacterium]
HLTRAFRFSRRTQQTQILSCFPYRSRATRARMARMADTTAGTLYLVSTPIGNLEDVTRRALGVLTEVDLIACEDTRHTRKLLERYGINTKTVSYHEHNERERAGELAARISQGLNVALVSDAGTPAISDPGYRLVRAAIAVGARVVPIPGATAFVAALTASGLPTDEFFFGGFLPARSTQRRARLAQLRAFPVTLVFYEAPHRITDALRDAREILGEREAVVARELTKLHEEVARGRLSELAEKFSGDHAARGEMVLIIDRTVIADAVGDQSDAATESVATLVAAYERDEGLDPRAALKRAARRLGLSRDEAYRRLVAERAQNDRE